MLLERFVPDRGIRAEKRRDMPAVFEHSIAARWDLDPHQILRQLTERVYFRGTDVIERALVICRLLDSDRDAVSRWGMSP